MKAKHYLKVIKNIAKICIDLKLYSGIHNKTFLEVTEYLTQNNYQHDYQRDENGYFFKCISRRSRKLHITVSTVNQKYCLMHSQKREYREGLLKFEPFKGNVCSIQFMYGNDYFSDISDLKFSPHCFLEPFEIIFRLMFYFEKSIDQTSQVSICKVNKLFIQNIDKSKITIDKRNYVTEFTSENDIKEFLQCIVDL